MGPRVAVAVVQGHYANPGSGTSAIGSLYQRSGEGQQIRKTQCMLL
jgi:hypothetical protein